MYSYRNQKQVKSMRMKRYKSLYIHWCSTYCSHVWIPRRPSERTRICVSGIVAAHTAPILSWGAAMFLGYSSHTTDRHGFPVTPWEHSSGMRSAECYCFQTQGHVGSDEKYQVLLMLAIKPNVWMNVWCGFHASAIVGPVFMGNRLAGDRYRHYLETKLQTYLGAGVLVSRLRIYFQQVGASPHFSCTVLHWLHSFCPDGGPVRGGLKNDHHTHQNSSPQFHPSLKSVKYENLPRSIAAV
jgi:hypothetical protein